MTEQIDANILSLITPAQAWHYRMVPFGQNATTLHFYYSAEDGAGVADELEMLTGKKIVVQKTADDILQELLERYYQQDRSDVRQQNRYYEGNADLFLNHLISEAKNLGSSDIHIEIYEDKCRVRIRVDGLLVQRYLLDKKQYPSLINKIKIVANLDIAEKRLPQDGRIYFEQDHHRFDIRVSILPTLHGEKIVLRLLNNDATNIDINALGFSTFDLTNYLEGIRKPTGILLISGPTGSGKTTTLYATLKLLNKDTRNILTIEDPIEYTLDGVNHVQVKDSIGLTFVTVLRTFLRQDPNIIMLGEIRDVETANMAIRAALTGHLVLSTIHTNSAWGIISRLTDMGIPSYLLANTLNTAVAQRLVRLLCPACKEKAVFDESLYPRKFKAFRKISHHFIARGCEACYNTGYKGRKAVYEVIPVDEELADHIKAGEFNVNALLKQKGVKTLSENAFELLESGATSLDEIYSLLMQ
jgi:general secretion pathway protein E/type IV pilus assembly protein PilB